MSFPKLMIGWLLLLVLSDLFGLRVEPIAAFRICPKLLKKENNIKLKILVDKREKKGVTNRRRFVECPKL